MIPVTLAVTSNTVWVLQRAQLAAAPLTKNNPRDRTVTFIDPPFMKFGLSILMKRGGKSDKIKNMLDLAGQSEIKYGVVGGGSTASFFSDRDRRDEYHHMWTTMENQRDVSFLDVEDGVKKVRESTDSDPYAFIGEKYMLEYHASRQPRDLIAVDGNVEAYNGEYHLAVTDDLDWDVRNRLSNALEQLKQSGRLEELYNKWWSERDQYQCSGAPRDSASCYSACDCGQYW